MKNEPQSKSIHLPIYIYIYLKNVLYNIIYLYIFSMSVLKEIFFVWSLNSFIIVIKKKIKKK